MKKLVYQMFILGVEQNKDEYFTKALKNGLGGVIFFTRDIQSKEQFKKLISEIKSKSLISPFLSIDQEGGKVERTENIHPRYLSPKFAYQKGKNFLITQTTEIAQELSEYGINLNFAPCADVNTNPQNPIIGERAFSDKTDEVSEAVSICSNIYRKNGIIPCIKHFPGHGDANKDSHLTLPCIELPLEAMEELHIRPFAENINSEMIMVAHLHCTCFDKEKIPSSLSYNTIKYLRNTLKYNGVIITDDMVMKGVQDFGSIEACLMAIKAGINMFIFRDTNKETVDLIEKIVQIAENDSFIKQQVINSNIRIQELKKRFEL